MSQCILLGFYYFFFKIETMGFVKQEERWVGKTADAEERNGKETVSFRSFRKIEKGHL